MANIDIDELEPTPEQKQGFDDGVLLFKHEPEMAKELLTKKPDDDYLKAMQAGVKHGQKKQFIKEQKEALAKAKLKQKSK